MIDTVPHTAAAAREYVAGWYAGTVSASHETIHAALWIAGDRRRDPLETGGDHWDFLADNIEWECLQNEHVATSHRIRRLAETLGK